MMWYIYEMSVARSGYSIEHRVGHFYSSLIAYHIKTPILLTQSISTITKQIDHLFIVLNILLHALQHFGDILMLSQCRG